MVQKRPFDAEEMLEVSLKHPKHAGSSDLFLPLSESVFPEDDYYTHVPKTSEGGYARGGGDFNEKLAGETCDGLPRGTVNSEKSFPVTGVPASSWTTSCTIEKDHRLEQPIHFSLFPEYLSPERPIYFSPERPIRTLTRYEDIYSILLEHPPRKPVAIGADHQADVPPWGFSGTTYEADKRLMGTCIIPMPQMELSSIDDEVGKGRDECNCKDSGSMRCVRQHIMEEREKILKTFGYEKFIELGFANMGEQVAEKWSPDDEHLFHKVVFNNPASLNKNFWDYLSLVFPSRSKKEIVSYYFNVFMLRKRAEQNWNHLGADSDNDEWQGSDDNEIASYDEDEDSLAEYHICRDDTCINNCNDNHMEDYDDEFAENETCVVSGIVDHTKKNIDNDSKSDPVDVHHSNGSSLNQSQDQPVLQDSCDETVKDDSIDSYSSLDTGVASREVNVKSGNGDHWCSNFNGVSNGYSQGYVLEPCDAPGWDSGFVSCSQNNMDFLPTCSMIEEVFGDGRRQDMRRA